VQHVSRQLRERRKARGRERQGSDRVRQRKRGRRGVDWYLKCGREGYIAECGVSSRRREMLHQTADSSLVTERGRGREMKREEEGEDETRRERVGKKTRKEEAETREGEVEAKRVKES
jgi:hypothetical protein